MPTKLTPIEAFQQYFLDVKPYHCKILEVLQRYEFSDNINISISETPRFNYTIKNNPVCKLTGWGIEYDDPCGFDTDLCCDMYACIGGYGIIYDNSDLTASNNITSVNAVEGKITISGDKTYDQRLQIKQLMFKNQLSIAGDQTNVLSGMNLFIMIPYNIYSIISYTSPLSFRVSGNYTTQFIQKKEFTVFNSGLNNGQFLLSSAVYDIITNTTLITVINTGKTFNTSITSGQVQIASNTRNNGVYEFTSAFFNGVDTVITLNTGIKSIDFVDSTAGSILLHTGYLENRNVDIENNDPNNDGEYRILCSDYDASLNQTNIYLTTTLSDDTNAVGQANLYGYITQPGFDADDLCPAPYQSDVRTYFSEKLVINYNVRIPQPTPTPSRPPSMGDFFTVLTRQSPT